MKKVWILEGFITPELMKQWLDDDKKLLETKKRLRRAIEQYPDGYWSGYQGNVIYRQFCEVAREMLRNMKNRMKFRVVTAEIEDNAKYWTEYRNPVENAEVLRYLMATL